MLKKKGSNLWFYSQLAKDGGIYEYPWRSKFEGPTAETIFAEEISKHINGDSCILDVGCGHGKFIDQWGTRVKEIIGIDITEEFINTANKNNSRDNIRYLVVDADDTLPFPNRYFDLIYTKKGPWLHREGSRIAKPGALIIGLYPGRTDGGLRELFPELYEPLPYNPYDIEYVMNSWRFKESIGLTDFKIQVIEEIEYLAAPEDVIIKRCFGQNETIKELVWRECPAYGRTRENMEASIEKFPKLIIYCDDIPIGVISVGNKGEGEYYLGCLCVIPQYQGRGIGTLAVKYMLSYYTDWKKITLMTPADKEENINFYTKRCGFKIDGTYMDGNVKVVHFLMER